MAREGTATRVRAVHGSRCAGAAYSSLTEPMLITALEPEPEASLWIDPSTETVWLLLPTLALLPLMEPMLTLAVAPELAWLVMLPETVTVWELLPLITTCFWAKAVPDAGRARTANAVRYRAVLFMLFLGRG